MMQRFPAFAFLCLVLLLWTSPTFAITDDDESLRVIPGDPDYTAGMVAFKDANWQGVLDHMTNVIKRRPGDDNAHNLMGFAYRKLGHYRLSLAHYQKALDLNPHHRGALEYLGETYLAMGCLLRAQETLTRLETACKRLAGDLANDDWQADCEAWRELKSAIDAYRESAKTGCVLD